MKNFAIIFRHYFIRSIRFWQTPVLLILLPLGLVTINMFGNGFVVGESNDPIMTLQASAIATTFMIAFQFFSMEVVTNIIFEDLKGPVRWRLFMTPVPQRTFHAAVSAAGFMVTIVQGISIFGISALVFGARIDNPLFFITVFMIVAVIVQLMGLIISQSAPTLRVASGITYAICFGMMIFSGILFIPLGDSALATFVLSYGTPLALATRAIFYAGPILDNMNQAMINLSVLLAITLVLAVVYMILGRRRKTS